MAVYIDTRIINISEITESLEPSVSKFPKLFTEISNKHFKDGEIPENFEYEIITDSIEKYAIHSYVCDVAKIKEV